MKKTICIVGGGASGMMAAIAAAWAGAQVTLLEHQDRIGKKILMTGNGKCNLTNLDMNCAAYGCAEDSLVGSVLHRFNQQDLMQLFERLGMRLKISRDSYVYPETEAAATVLNVLRRALVQAGVVCRTKIEVSNIRKEKQFVIETNQGDIRADCVILACGGKSYPKTGSDGSGFRLAQSLGIELEKNYPALTALVCKKSGLKAIAGMRSEGKVTLYIEECPKAHEYGQIQFTDYGLSGIPVFQISSLASKALLEGKKVRVEVNLFPNLGTEETEKAIQRQLQQFCKLSFDEARTGFLHKKWIDYLGKQLGFSRFASVESIPKNEIRKLVSELTEMSFPVEQVKGYEFCQVTGGGVLTNQMDEYLQVRRIPGLYIVGEMLDVIGKCGGYNLQWAFSTGYIAGQHAAQ